MEQEAAKPRTKTIELNITQVRFKKIKQGENHFDLKNEGFWRTFNEGDTLLLHEYCYNFKLKTMQLTGKSLTRTVVSTQDIKNGRRIFFK